MNGVPQDPAFWQALFIGVVTVALALVIYQNRKHLASVNTPYIDELISKAIYWLVGLVILTTIATAALSIFGVTNPIRVLSAESLCYLAVAYALVRWAQR
ncbi:MAG: hypothetical protein RIC14_00120 [Filomicrobium sp.]